MSNRTFACLALALAALAAAASPGRLVTRLSGASSSLSSSLLRFRLETAGAYSRSESLPLSSESSLQSVDSSSDHNDSSSGK
jgi:hypothetical protein